MQLCLKNCVQYLVCMSSSPPNSDSPQIVHSYMAYKNRIISTSARNLLCKKKGWALLPQESVLVLHASMKGKLFLMLFSYTVLKHHLTNCFKSIGRISGYILSRRTAKRKCISLARFPARSCWKSEDRLQEYILRWLELYFLEPIFFWAIL